MGDLVPTVPGQESGKQPLGAPEHDEPDVPVRSTSAASDDADSERDDDAYGPV